MSHCPFCNIDPASGEAAKTIGDNKRPAGIFHRAWRSAQWLFPTALLVLMPKCPLCVAAYIALFTGIGVTAATGRWIQILLLVFCLSSLAFLAVRTWRRSWSSMNSASSTATDTN
jgi:hypothetical protein